jgi:hypothetical protein
MAEFYLFCYELHRVWIRSNRGDMRPWTRDPVLHRFFFCNVFLELDRGTAYFHSQVARLARDDPRLCRESRMTRREWLNRVAWRSYAYRLVNRIETLEATQFPIAIRSRSGPFEWEQCNSKRRGHAVQGGRTKRPFYRTCQPT